MIELELTHSMNKLRVRVAVLVVQPVVSVAGSHLLRRA